MVALRFFRNNFFLDAYRKVPAVDLVLTWEEKVARRKGDTKRYVPDDPDLAGSLAEA